MVAQRRLRPLGIVVVLGLAVVAARLFQVQVVEHEVWAAQARSFVSSSRVVPYHRGSFLDREGRVLVADEDVASIEFVYRDFRRGHPIGLAAHARTALEGRPVGLVEAERDLAAWCARIVSLSPAALGRFARGEALRDAENVELVPATADAESDARPSRAADLTFYAQQLLAVERREIGPARAKIEAGDGERPWCAIVAGLRTAAVEGVLASVERRAEESRADLRVLAGMLAEEKILKAPDAATAADPLARLLELLDERRSDQEDEAADELFETACGFGPGRMPTEALRDTFELGWIARSLRWDAARLDAWIASRRGAWERELEDLVLPRVLASADLGESEGARAQRLLDGLAAVWRAGEDRRTAARSWTDLDALKVIHEARTLFRSPRGEVADEAPRLAFQDDDYRALAAVEDVPWRSVGLLFESAALRAGLASPSADEIAKRWSTLSESRDGLDGEEALEEARRAVRAFEADFSGAVMRTLAALRGPPRTDATGAALHAPLELADERLDRVAQRERYIQVDAQSRASRLAGEPSYALVQLVARDPERYAGFTVRETTRRVARIRDADGAVAAGLLIGTTRRPFLRELLAQSEDQRRLSSLQYRLLRDDDEERELRELAMRLARVDEWTGDQGLEAWFDPELRGDFGVYETEGLDAEQSGEGARLVPAVDGRDVTLTLQADLQVAAQDVLAHPRMPTGDTDRTLFENMVGAIVLLTPDGQVLAAASAPTLPGAANVPGRGYQRSQPRDRTAQTPTFNPPGSVFKPFVSAYALDKLGFDPATRFECRILESGHPGFDTLRCANLHHESDLHHALAVSCNAYFAQLGLCFQPRELLDAARTFGFGEPTGVRFDPREGRRGLVENWKASPDLDEAGMLARLKSRVDHERFPNGLGLLWASPLQVARATAGLVTGSLPELRIVRAIGGVPVPGVSRPVGLSEASLEFVREAMRAVVLEVGGSGHAKGLDPATLGFSFACKTGSADVGKIVEVPGMPDEDREAMAANKSRKHTWVAGWFPADDPVGVVVIYLHNTTETASKTAVHVASQFLQTAPVRELVARKGAQ